MNNYCLTFLLFVNAVFSNNYWIWLLYGMKNNYNNADQGGCYPPIQKTQVDNTLQDMSNFVWVIKTKLNVYNSFKI